MKYKKFNFLVENMSDKQAKFLLDLINALVVLFGLKMGGGFSSTNDEEILKELEREDSNG